MKLYDLLLKTISKMPNGWGETVQVDLTNGWTAPSDGMLLVRIAAQGDVAYISQDSNARYICIYAAGGGNTTSTGAVHKGNKYRISHKGRNVSEVEGFFTPFSYRGGYFSRLIKRLQSLFLKGVVA